MGTAAGRTFPSGQAPHTLGTTAHSPKAPQGLTIPPLPTALFVFCTKSRRAERYWQKTLLQMEEMESQIREEIRKGSRQGPRGTSGLCFLCWSTHGHLPVLQASLSCRQT